MTALDDKAALIKEQAAAMLRDVENDRRYLDWRFGEALQGWAQQNLPPGKKSLKLLTGTLAFRTSPERLEVVDEATAIKWAFDNCQAAYKMVEALDKKALTAHFKASGELPPGCELKPATENFSVKGAL